MLVVILIFVQGWLGTFPPMRACLVVPDHVFFVLTKMIVSADQISRTDYRPNVQQVPLRRIVQKHYPLNRRSESDFTSPITFQIDDRPPLEFIRSCSLRMPLVLVKI